MVSNSLLPEYGWVSGIGWLTVYVLCLTGLLQGVEMWVCGKILAAFFFWIPSTHKRLMQCFLNSLVGKRQPVIQNRAWSPFYLPNHNLLLKLKILVSPSEKIEGAVSQCIYLMGIMKIKSSFWEAESCSHIQMERDILIAQLPLAQWDK